MRKLLLLSLALVTLNMTSCKREQDDIIPTVVEQDTVIAVGTQFVQEEITSQSIVLNPVGNAPLSAMISIETSVNTKVEIRVLGKNGLKSDVSKTFSNIGTAHKIPVFGLYAGYNNIVHLTLYDEKGTMLGTSGVYIQTKQLHSDLPTVRVDVPYNGERSDMHIVSYYGHGGESTPQEVFIFDKYGDIRWYLDFTNHSILSKLHYQDGVEMLRNGNLYFGDVSTHTIYEVDFFGDIVNTWPMPGYKFHHHVLELPNGNFLITATKENVSTYNDYIIEIDRNSKSIVTTWNLQESLQKSRDAWITNTTNWIHVNAVEYDAASDCIIISGRNQGLAKITRDNKVKWILSTHNGWDKAGDGTDLTTKLLHPLTKDGMVITDTSILNGRVNHTDFEWSWYQHAPKLLPNGNLLVFDNGDNRNFTGNLKYSRAVEYRIDEGAMTIAQVWQYGKQRGQETFSDIVSDVDYYQETNTVVFTPGSVTWPSSRGKIVEVNRMAGNVVFEVTVLPPTSLSRITMHRSHKISLY